MEDLKKSEPWRVFRIQSELVEGFETLNDLGPAVNNRRRGKMKSDLDRHIERQLRDEEFEICFDKAETKRILAQEIAL